MSEMKFKLELEKTLNPIAVPESLFQFAKEVPERYENGEFATSKISRMTDRRKLRFAPIFTKCAVAAAILSVTFTAGVNVSPAFASFMKTVPGFEVAVDWLTQLRDRDGVQVAIANGYTPIEPVTTQIGGTTITVSDIYVTDDELFYKTFIRSTEFDVTNEMPTFDMYVTPKNLRGGGSNTGSALVKTREGMESVKMVSYKFQLLENEVENFFAKGLNTLEFTVKKRSINREAKDSKVEEIAMMSVPMDQKMLLHNKVLEPKQALAFGVSDPDLSKLTLEKLTIQPTTMNAIISGQAGWTIDFPRDEKSAPYLKDEKGNIYRYDPSGSVLELGDHIVQLPFLGSTFFDKTAKTLQLHIGTVLVSEASPSGRFELSTKDTFPKTVRFKNRDIVIEGAEFQDGYIHLKVKKERPDQERYEGVRFFIPEFENQLQQDKELGKKVDALRTSLNIYGWELADNYGQAYLSAYIPAPKQEQYTISLQRFADPIVVNKDYTVKTH